jgi:hypothetical protein
MRNIEHWLFKYMLLDTKLMFLELSWQMVKCILALILKSLKILFLMPAL